MKAPARSFIGLMVSAVVLAGMVASAAFAQQYPSRPVRVVVVFAPGGATDVVGRLAFQKVGQQLGQQFLIDNRAGASGTIGAAIVAKSPPDGYTVMVYSATILANAHIYKRLPYDPLKDFIGLTPVARMVGMLVVHPSMPVRSTKDLIALAKARPGEIMYGTAGPGAFQHLSTSLFANMAGLSLTHIPYKGGAPATAAMAAGEVQMMLTPASEAVPHLKSGRVRPIAVSSATRTTQFPEIPTIGETVKGYEFTSWMGTFVPAGTPKPIVDKLNAELKKAVADRDVGSRLSALTLDPMHMSIEEFAKLLKSEYDKYEHVVKLSGARIE
ncbi:MAG TPA: tripartite tricarboxylate transporter substrate-binding protein [Burkholderiales bacterium]|nr:tripartite tricarboxylate transporter substrate-binding protein [Burkholderiales bacterium]